MSSFNAGLQEGAAIVANHAFTGPKGSTLRAHMHRVRLRTTVKCLSPNLSNKG